MATGPPGRPLVVDIDGTLIMSDLLHETASAYLLTTPLGFPRIVRWLATGKARLKSELGSRARIDATSLPFNPVVLDWLREEHVQGRRLVLASASDLRVAQDVADQLGIFDEVIASTDGVNLKGALKRDALVARFGEGGFDYLGDDHRDLAVWSHADTAHVVGDSPAFLSRVSEVARVGRTFPSGRDKGLRAVVQALRPHQWVKNMLVAVPLLTAHESRSADTILATALAVVSFCLAASSVYVLNDISDVANDRNHPIKRARPIASGRLSLLVGWVLWPLLMAAGLGVALVALPPLFAAALAAYLAATTAYTFWLKRKPVLDVVTLGALYTLRIVAGAAAIAAPLSMWLLTFSMFFFLSLALIKRVSELTRVRRTMARQHGRGYVEADLELLSSYGVASSVAAVVIFALYVNDERTAILYETPELLWCTVPVLLAWLMRAWLLAHRGTLDEDPILWSIRDRASIAAGIVVLVTFAAARVLSL